MEDPWYITAFAVSIPVFIGVAMVYRLRKKAHIRKTLARQPDGAWTWIDMRGRPQRSHLNPIEEMKKDGEEAQRQWRSR